MQMAPPHQLKKNHDLHSGWNGLSCQYNKKYTHILTPDRVCVKIDASISVHNLNMLQQVITLPINAEKVLLYIYLINSF